jgi:hypothetical protein
MGIEPGNNDNPKTTKEAIFDMHKRIMRLEVTVVGNPGTKDDGLVGDMRRAWKCLDNHSKYIWLLGGIAIGSGIVGGVGLIT